MGIIDDYFAPKQQDKKIIQEKNTLYNKLEAAKADYYGYLRAHRGDIPLAEIYKAYERMKSVKDQLYYRAQELGIEFPSPREDIQLSKGINDIYKNNDIIILVDGDQVHNIDNLLSINDAGIIVFTNNGAHFERVYDSNEFLLVEVKPIKEAADVAIEAVLKKYIIQYGAVDKKFVVISKDRGFYDCLIYLYTHCSVANNQLILESNIDNAKSEIVKWKQHHMKKEAIDEEDNTISDLNASSIIALERYTEKIKNLMSCGDPKLIAPVFLESFNEFIQDLVPVYQFCIDKNLSIKNIKETFPLIATFMPFLVDKT